MRKYVFILCFLVEKEVNAENENKIFIAILKMFYVYKPMVLIQNICIQHWEMCCAPSFLFLLQQVTLNDCFPLSSLNVWFFFAGLAFRLGVRGTAKLITLMTFPRPRICMCNIFLSLNINVHRGPNTFPIAHYSKTVAWSYMRTKARSCWFSIKL